MQHITYVIEYVEHEYNVYNIYIYTYVNIHFKHVLSCVYIYIYVYINLYYAYSTSIYMHNII